MVKTSSPKKNFLYNSAYQLLILVVPLIIAPYLSRVLGPNGVGIYSYTYSIVYYFMMITLLGVNNYGNRRVAQVRDNKRKLSKEFWSIYCLQLIMGSIMILLYLLYIFFFVNDFKFIAIIQTIYIFSAILDINWLFFGLEEFKKTIIRNSFVKIGSVLLIFLLVNNENDVWKYALIMSAMTCLSQIVLWSFIKGKITFIKITWKDIFKHIKPNLVLFIPVIAVSLYKIMDKIMLGGMTSVSEVGLYENAEKILNVPLAIITALGTVMLPRMSNIVAKKDFRQAKKYISKSIVFIMFLSYAMLCGLIVIGYKFAPFFFGEEFQKTGLLIILLAITLPFISFANVLRTQFLIPMEKDKIYIKSVFLGAFTNLFMNIIFIPKYGSIGACYGTIAAEFIVMLYQAVSINGDLPVISYFLDTIPFLIKSLIMLLIIYPLNYLTLPYWLILLLQIIIGMITYALMNIKYILSIIKFDSLFKNNKAS